MIAREWRGVVARDRADDYVADMDATGVAEYRRATGCLVSMILTRDAGADRVAVVAFSVWDTRASLQAFTGSDIDAMVLYPEDDAFLLEPPTLDHHRVDPFQR